MSVQAEECTNNAMSRPDSWENTHELRTAPVAHSRDIHRDIQIREKEIGGKSGYYGKWNRCNKDNTDQGSNEEDIDPNFDSVKEFLRSTEGGIQDSDTDSNTDSTKEMIRMTEGGIDDSDTESTNELLSGIIENNKDANLESGELEGVTISINDDPRIDTVLIRHPPEKPGEEELYEIVTKGVRPPSCHIEIEDNTMTNMIHNKTSDDIYGYYKKEMSIKGINKVY